MRREKRETRIICGKLLSMLASTYSTSIAGKQHLFPVKRTSSSCAQSQYPVSLMSKPAAAVPSTIYHWFLGQRECQGLGPGAYHSPPLSSEVHLSLCLVCTREHNKEGQPLMTTLGPVMTLSKTNRKEQYFNISIFKTSCFVVLCCCADV